jgi:hypothetical protein
MQLIRKSIVEPVLLYIYHDALERDVTGKKLGLAFVSLSLSLNPNTFGKLRNVLFTLLGGPIQLPA